MKFIRRNIDSAEQLRVLLYLYAHRDRAHRVADLVTELRSTERSIRKRLNDLYARGVLLRGDHADVHQFACPSGEYERLVEQLEKINQSHASGVIDAIFARHHTSVQSIADAFHLGRRRK